MSDTPINAAQFAPFHARARPGFVEVAQAGARERLRGLVWPALISLAALAAAAPLWVSSFLPFQDAPEHLAAVRVIADYSKPAPGFRDFFVLDLRRLEYLGFYLPAAALARLVGSADACRILLTLVALALPAAAVLLLRSFKRDFRLAVFAPALFHTVPLYLGFFNFTASVPATIAAVALTERELHAPTRTRGLLLGLLSACLLWLHPSGLGLALGAAGLLAISSGERWRKIGRGLLPLLPAALLLAIWALKDLLARPQARSGTGLTWDPLSLRLLDMLRFGNVLAGHADEVFAAALLVLFLGAALTPRVRSREAMPSLEVPRLRAFRLPLLAVATVALYLALPSAIGNAGFINLRALPFLAMLVLCTPLLARRRAVSALLAAAVALQLGYSILLSSEYRAFDREAGAQQLESVLARAQPGKRLLAIIYQQDSKVFQFASYLHFGLYYEIERGGRARFNFAEFPWTPVRFRPGTALPLPRSLENHPERFRASRDAIDEDYLLLREPGPPPGAPFSLLVREGRWALYQRGQ